MKKFLSVLLALSMMLSLSVPAFAMEYSNEVYDELEGRANSKVMFQVVNTCEHDGSKWVDNGDGTHDEICTGCGEVLTDDAPHVDLDDDGVCDKCGAELSGPGCEHDDGAHWVDNGDGTHDEICNGCGGVVINDEEHEDGDNDRVCDKCGALIAGTGPVLIATVPLKLPILMDLKGNITVSTNAVVQNHVQDRAIAVTDIMLDTAGDWAIGNMVDDFSQFEPDSKILAMSFRHDTHDGSGVFALSDNNWNIAAADSLKLNMAAKVPVWTKECGDSEIADVEFVLNWATDAGAVTSDADTGAGDQADINAGIAVSRPEKPSVGDFSVQYDSGLLLAGGTKNAVLSWSGYDEAVEVADIVVADPEVVDIVETESNDGNMTLAVNGLKLGESEVTAVLSNGDETAFDVTVCEVDESGIEVNMPDGLYAGDKIMTGDVEIKMPVKHPDGVTSEIVVRPEIDAVVGEGKTELKFNVFAGGKVTEVSDAVFTAASFVVTAENRGMIGYTGAENEVLNIPAEFDGEDGVHYVVTGIGDSAFRDCTGLSSVVISDGVESIGPYAFSNCTGLLSIDIPDSVQSIGTYGFYCCSAISSIIIPDGITSIEPHTFCACRSLLSFEIPDSVETIGIAAFSNCDVLSSVVIPDGVKSIGNDAFSGCCVLSSVVIPDGVTSIERRTFENCYGLSSIVIPDSVTSIADNAFAGCASLSSVRIPDSVVSIGWAAFSRCESLSSVVIPNYGGLIGHDAFSYCTSLTSVVISDGSTLIPDSMFYHCTSLSSVFIPDSVTSVGMLAFDSCTSLSSLRVPNTVSSIGGRAFFGVPKVVYNGPATGAPWGALSVVKT